MMIRRGAVGDMLDGGRRKRSRAYPALLVWVFCVLCAWLTPALAGERGAVGDLYVSNVINDNVLQYDGQTGEFVGQFVRTGSGGLDEPYDLTWGPNGNLFVVNSRDHGQGGPGRIMEYDGQTGEFVRVFVNGKRRGWEHPKGLAFGGPDGNLFVLDDRGGGHESVQEFDGVTGKFIRVVIEDFREWNFADPWSMKFGPNGNLFVSDETIGAPTFFEFDPHTGERLRCVICFDRQPKTGFIYEGKRATWLITESSFSRIERFDYETGDPIEVIIDDGRGVLKLDTPFDLAYGPSGNLFVVGGHTLVAKGQDTGAMHEYDGVTYEEVRVFGYARDWPPTKNELFLPFAIEFKPLPGDYGGDHAGGDWDVDLWDYSRFMKAFTGPGVRSRDARALIAFDADHDGDLDLDDYHALHAALTGPK